MMIRLNVALAGVSPFKRRVTIEAEDGATVEEILYLYKKKYRADDLLSRTRGLSAAVNGALANFNRQLKDGDQVKVFRPGVRG